MKPSPFKYHSPTSVAEAIQLLGELDNPKLLAGGQSLIPMMNFRFMMPTHVIDLNQIQALSGIELRGETLYIGAMTRQHDIHTSSLIKIAAPIIAEAYDMVSHRQIRNRGTLGGSLCHLDPSSEQPCFISVLDGSIDVVGPNGPRSIKMGEWTSMYMTPAMSEQEVMIGVHFSPWPRGHGWAFLEYSRRHGDYAIVGVAVLVTLNEKQEITQLAISICGISYAPCRLSNAELKLLGMKADHNATTIAAQCIDAIEDIMEDAHNSSDYRRHLAKTYTQRALELAFHRANNADHGQHTH
jgi:carbon-monoxide dehydrogenase medium subunit